jgi:hypothetical protein
MAWKKLVKIQGKDGKTPVAGVDFKIPKDGYTPVKGLDYFDGLDAEPVDEEEIIKELIKKMPDPIKGDKGDIGDTPEHQWKGTKLRFEKQDGDWGKWVDLIGKGGIASIINGGRSVKVSDNDSIIGLQVRQLDFGAGISVTGDNEKVVIEAEATDPVWGAITGTLSDQTDLQNALDAKLSQADGDIRYLKLDCSNDPLQADLDMGDFDLENVSQLKLNTGYTIDDTEPAGSTYWNSDESTIETALENGVSLQHGQEMHYDVKNDSGAQIDDGQVVKFKGTLGASGKITVDLAIADNSVPAIYNIGVATQDIGIGEFGKITKFGKVRGVNTTGAAESETWNDGDILYVSPTTAGALTKVKPNAPDLVITMAVVVHAHTNGTLFVRPTFLGKMTEMDDVNGTPMTTDGQFMVWDQTNGYFDSNYNINDYISLATGDARYLNESSNLSDLTSKVDARANLGLGSAALEDTDFFLQVANNLSDLDNVATARTNLGLVAGGSGDIWAYRTLDDTISATWTFSDSSNGGIIMNNSVEIFYGSLKEFSTSFDKADATSNFLKHDMPTAAANTVPVEAWGVGIKDVDLGLFDGQTNPLLALFNLDRTKYQYWGWNDTENAGIYGSSERLMFLTGTDQIKFSSSLSVHDTRAIFRSSLGRISRFELGEGSSSMFYMEHNGIYNRAGLFVTTWNYRHMIFGDSNNRAATWSVPEQDNPTFILTATTSPNVEKGWMVAMDVDGIHGGRREGANYSVSSGRMSRDNAPRDLHFTAAGAWVSATVNLDGADVILGGGPSTGAGTDGVVKSRSIFEIIDGLEERFYDVGNSNYVGFKAPALTANQIWTLPAVDGSADDIMKTDGSGNLDFATPTVEIDISFDTYDAEPSRASESNIHGGLASLATGQPLDSSPTDLVVTKGIGKMVIVINAGSDISGEITVTGETIDRNTGASTPGDTDVITVDALTTDGSTTDSNGNIVHVFTGAYITSKWFTGTVTLSTTDLTLTDVDVYHCSFEQFNDQSDLLLKSFDANIYTTHVNAEFDAYLHTIHVTGDKCNIDCEAELHVGADGETAIANKYWRLRRGNIDEALDGTTDGFWVDVHYSNSPAYVEDVSLKIWVTKTAPLILT